MESWRDQEHINCPGKQKGSKSEAKPKAEAVERGVSYPWDYLENPADEHFSNYIAWEKWLQTKDKDDLMDEVDILPRTFLYAVMCELAEGN